MIRTLKRTAIRRNVLVGCATLFVFAVFNVLWSGGFVHAADNSGPNVDWFSGVTIRYTLEQDSAVNGAGNLKIPIYVFNGSTTQHPSIRVTAGNSSSGSNSSIAPACLTLSATAKCGQGTGCQIDCSMTIPAASFQYDPTIQGWFTLIGAHLNDQSSNAGEHDFRLSAPGAVIGYFASTNRVDRSFAVSQDYGGNQWTTYQVPFGSDCSVQAAVKTSFVIYDGDVGQSGVQPFNAAHPFRLRLIDTTSGQTLVDNTVTNAAQVAQLGLGNGGIATFPFTAQPNHNFQLRIDNVYSNNTLQFRLPYSSIYAQTTCNYSLNPSVSVSPNSAEANTIAQVLPVVSNTGVITSTNTQWQLSRFVVPSGGTLPPGGISPTAPSPFYGFPISIVGQGVGVSYPVGLTNLSTLNDDLGNQSLGSRVCYALSVKAYSDTDSSWSHSVPSCVTIGKKPKVKVLGSDLILGRPFIGGTGQQSSANTSISVLNPQNSPNVFGSWVEYGIFATNTITGLGSSAAFAAGATAMDTCSYSHLTFVNATTSNPATSCSASTTVGNYTTGRTIPDIASDFPVVNGTTVYSDALASPQGLYTSNDHGTPVVSDPITIGTHTIKKGEWFVINAPNADVTITGDITYDTSALQSIYDIPQLVIIAKNIYINPNVKRVDAWLIAQGSNVAGTGILDSCHVSTDYATQLTTNSSQTGICDTLLQVNGPVMAQKLWLRRTGGVANTDSAEVFNLRPDAYLWSFARASVSGRLQTVNTKELPPRF